MLGKNNAHAAYMRTMNCIKTTIHKDRHTSLSGISHQDSMRYIRQVAAHIQITPGVKMKKKIAAQSTIIPLSASLISLFLLHISYYNSAISV